MTYLGFPVRMKQDVRKILEQWGLISVLVLLGLGLLVILQFSHQPFTLTLVKTIAVEQEPLGLALSPDFATLYVANAQSGTISVIDTASQRVIKTLTVNPGGRLNSIIVSADGQTLYVSDAKAGTVEVFKLPEAEQTAGIPVRLFPQRMALSQEQNRLYVVNSASNNVSVIDMVTHALLTNIPVNERPYAIAIAPDHSRAYITSSQTHSITILDLASQKAIDAIVLESISRLTNLVISPDGRYLYICDAISNSIVVVDTTVKRQVRTLNAAKFEKSDLEFSPTDLALSTDGKRLYVIGRTGYLSVIALENHEVLASLEVGQDLRNIALAPDGTSYISSFGTNSVSIVQ
ncbi:hypothetical protein U27_03996 [Candidatus Vecturithrix granuli]|uniref:40-residue YVTN family beta-propeller repeat protein n=1 Tax=Vecturithrix granuli TaxID=1499967 RepID=A0A081BXH7_VECG1|nr:hypothetical protein U27_03996 [Candidatus Vecturithrix granuli]